MTIANETTELRRGHDHANSAQQPAMESLLHLHVHESGICTSSLLLVSIHPSLSPIYETNSIQQLSGNLQSDFGRGRLPLRQGGK